MKSAIREGVGDLDNLETAGQLAASIEGNIVAILSMLAEDVSFDDPPEIPAAIEYAEHLARRSIPAASLRRAYHFGSDDLLAQVFEEVRRIDIEPEARLRLLHHLAGWLHSYVDWITRIVLGAYDNEMKQLEERQASLTASVVRAVLDDRPGSQSDFAGRTGFRLQQHHVAAILWVAQANPGIDYAEFLRQRAQEIAADTDSGRPLFTMVDRSTAWVWFGSPTEPTWLDDIASSAVVRDHERLRLALGVPASGVEGFRRSHRTAGAAHRVATVAGSTVQVFSHADRAVALVAMLIDDLSSLVEWVQDVLGPLAANTEAASRLRETLRVFLASDGNYKVAAEQLMLHRNSVKYRIGRAVALRGRPIGRDRLDIENALEAVRILGPSVFDQASES